MGQTLLIDLDDTLLNNRIETFLPAYLQALSESLSSFVEPQKLVAALLAATRQMVLNERPNCTLQQVFNAAFYPTLSIDPAILQFPLERFYAEIYPSLRSLTHPIPEAIEFVEAALARGCRLVVATNPLFPRTAILQRLEWAGLPADRFPFELVTSYETFHFAKPNPAFFAEVLGRLGWPEGAVVIGNDLENDISAGRSLGLPSYWVNTGRLPEKGAPIPAVAAVPLAPTAQGSLVEALTWLDNAEPAALEPNFTSPDSLLATLCATPAVLDTMCTNLPEEAWTYRYRPQEWSPTEILCHLRDVDEEVNLPRIRKVLAEENPFLAGKDTDPWAVERNYICQNGPQALERFMVVRMKLIDVLEGLSPAEWQRPARHAIFSRTNLAELVSIVAGHDRLHLQQFTTSLKPG